MGERFINVVFQGTAPRICYFPPFIHSITKTYIGVHACLHVELHVKHRVLGRSKVWGRGYTTIPLTVRRFLALENGDVLEWYITDRGEIIIKKRDKP
jgi:hypothetical protein